jgi:hypothetical protein
MVSATVPDVPVAFAREIVFVVVEAKAFESSAHRG